MSSPSLAVRVLSSQRLFPPTRPSTPSTLHLSSVDASVANFSPTGAIWFFDKDAVDTTSWSEEEDGGGGGGGGDQSAVDVVEHLRASLITTLQTYVPWTGTLAWAPYDPKSTLHTRRFRRIQLTWGTEADPGVEFVSAVVGGGDDDGPRQKDRTRLADVIPNAWERAREVGPGSKVWDHTDVKLDGLLPSIGKLALRSLRVWPNAPCLAAQVTKFTCGGIAVAVVMSHPLGDATALAKFVRDWTAIARAMASSGGTMNPPVLTPPIFDPQLLDRAAAGDIDAAKPDPQLVAQSRSLPSLRYDWWAKGDEECPWPGAFSAMVPDELDPTQIQPFGDPLPWSQWDTRAPCLLYIVHFSGREITHMWEDAAAASSATGTTTKITRHDALLSHLFRLIGRSRNLPAEPTSSSSPTLLHLSISLHLRPRLPHPLPAHYMGSPIIMGTLSLPHTTLFSTPLSSTAASINAVTSAFNASSVPALLHDVAYADAPHRIWRGFLGQRHSMVTSWVHCRMYEVDFGLGKIGWGGGSDGGGKKEIGGQGRPRYVEAVLVNLDGLVQIMELGGGGVADANGTGNGEGEGRGHWSDGGVDVFLSLEREAMGRFLGDGKLRRYE